jgi:hypothetical protein
MKAASNSYKTIHSAHNTFFAENSIYKMPNVQKDGHIYNALTTKLKSCAWLIKILCLMIIRIPLHLG